MGGVQLLVKLLTVIYLNVTSLHSLPLKKVANVRRRIGFPIAESLEKSESDWKADIPDLRRVRS